MLLLKVDRRVGSIDIPQPERQLSAQNFRSDRVMECSPFFVGAKVQTNRG